MPSLGQVLRLEVVSVRRLARTLKYFSWQVKDRQVCAADGSVWLPTEPLLHPKPATQVDGSLLSLVYPVINSEI